ncbi:hypothetical protein [Psychromonas sp. Urea-02u-13]|uniref:hypothetical protein n=1 Tax=Psychromonas sp. Urea-02u-13 TaxID=2058326 RepID=UPI0018E35075|nr:hypothetical protein [Psychromonas sp. Urea-02u-13]
MHWIPVFTRPQTVDIILNSLRFLMAEGLNVHAYVILENHLHLVAQSDQLGKDLARLKLDTHATSICKVSKENGADILGIKLKPSHSKSKFYNDVDWRKLPCPTGRKLAYYSTMAALRYNN